MTVETKGKEINAYVTESRKSFEKHLKELVDIPSVSADPAHRKDMDRCAEKAAELLKAFGATAEILQTGGNPVIIGEFASAKDHPTVMIYNHMDVQPADPS